MPNGSLVISDVTTDDTGVYTCIAGNTCNIRDTAAQLYVVGEEHKYFYLIGVGFFFLKDQDIKC